MKEEIKYDFELSSSVIHKLEELSYGLQTEILNKFSMATAEFFLSWSSNAQQDFYDCCENVDEELKKIVSDIDFEVEKIRKMSQCMLLTEEKAKRVAETNEEI